MDLRGKSKHITSWLVQCRLMRLIEALGFVHPHSYPRSHSLWHPPALCVCCATWTEKMFLPPIAEPNCEARGLLSGNGA